MLTSFLLFSWIIAAQVSEQDGVKNHSARADSSNASERMSEEEFGNLSKKNQSEIEKNYPFDQWKKIGFCDWEKKILLTMKVPKVMNWQSECNNGGEVKGIKCCGPSESTPRLYGEFLVAGKKRGLQVGMEAYETKTMEKIHKKKIVPVEHGWDYYDTVYGNKGALVFKKNVLLEGKKAFLIKIDDKGMKVPDPELSTLIRFEYQQIGGMIYFIEAETGQPGAKQVRHRDHELDNIADRILNSVDFTMKVDNLKSSK